MDLIKITLSYNTSLKLSALAYVADRDKKDVNDLSTIAKIDEPKIVAKNWYKSNTGLTLNAIIYVKGSYSKLSIYNTVSFTQDNIKRVYSIYNSRQVDKYLTILEVGV